MIKNYIERLKGQKHLKNLTVYGVGQVFNLITPLLVAPHIIAVSGMKGYGKAATVMAFMFFLMVIIDYGSDIVGVKDVAVNRDDRTALGKIFRLTYSAKLILFLAVIAVMCLVFNFVGYFREERLLYLLSLPVLAGQFINPTWFLQGVENFNAITFLNILSKILFVTGVFVFIRLPGDYILVNLWWGIGTIAANSIAFLYLRSKYSFTLRGVEKEELRGFFKNGFTILSSQIFMSLQLYSPIILINFFGSSIMAGQYRVVDQVIVIFKTYIFLFFNFIYPKVCYILNTSVKQGIRFWKIYNGANFAFISAAMAVIYIFSDEVVRYFNAKCDMETISSLLRIGVFIPLLLAISTPLKQLVLGFDKQLFYSRATIIIIVINLLALVVVIPVFKIEGVFFSLIIAETVTSLLFFKSIKNKLGMHAD